MNELETEDCDLVFGSYIPSFWPRDTKYTKMDALQRLLEQPCGRTTGLGGPCYLHSCNLKPGPGLPTY